MAETVLPLASLAPGVRGAVVALRGGGAFQSRVMSMGLHVGCEVEVLRACRGRGPVLLGCGDTRLAIGGGMAEKILIAVDGE